MAPYIPPHRRSTGSGDLPSPTTSTTSSRSSSPDQQTPRWCRMSDSGASPELNTRAPPSPPQRHRALVGDWRRGAAPKPTNPDRVVGRVVLLPADNQIPATSIARREARGSPWNHPAVITEAWDAFGIKFVKVRTCTSFGGNGLTAHKQQHHHRYFVEADRNHLTADSDEFAKQTWVNCSPNSEFTIEFQHLRVQTGRGKGDIQFSQDSLDEFEKNELCPRRDSLF